MRPFWRSSWIGWVAGALAVLAALLWTQSGYMGALIKHRQPPIMTWGAVHYELNARYFKELRYTDLYACAIEADKEVNQLYYANLRVRDLRTYREALISDYEPCPKERFTEARWQQFVGDIRALWLAPTWMYGLFVEDPVLYWNSIIFDKGYNAPPPLIALTRGMFWVFERIGGSSFSRALATLVDIGFMFAAVVAVYRHLGKRSALWLALGFASYWAFTQALLGHIWQHVWFASLVFMIVDIKRKRWRWAGWWLGFATMTRVFPLFFLVPLVMRWWQTRTTPDHPDHAATRHMLIACACACVGLGLVGLANGLGMEGWVLFVQKMHAHATYITAEIYNMGWNNLMGMVISPDPSEYVRLEVFARWKWVAQLVAIGMSAGLLYAYRRVSLARLVLLGVPFIFLWVVLSPLYSLTVLLIPLVIEGERMERGATCSREDTWILIASALLLVEHILFVQSGITRVISGATLHILSQVSFLVYFCLVAYALHRGSSTQASHKEE